jgi:hypothetical protein
VLYAELRLVARRSPEGQGQPTEVSNSFFERRFSLFARTATSKGKKQVN